VIFVGMCNRWSWGKVVILWSPLATAKNSKTCPQ